MPKLIENVLIGDQVRLVGEDVSEADAKGVRPEVFAGAEDPSESETTDDQGTEPDGAGGGEPEDPSGDPSDDAEEEQGDPSESEKGDDGDQTDEPAKPSGGRGKRTSTK